MRKKSLLFSVFFLMGFLAFAQNEQSLSQQYIAQYRDLAISEMVRTGVPAAITLAQGILESGNGQSDLAIRSNNHFGIKCKSDWTGGKVYHDDDEANECFRSYPTVEDSYRDHSDFLRNRPNYAFLFNLDPTDFEGWCKGLKKAGYATSPAYPKMLMDVINRYNLQSYTLLALEKMQLPKETPIVLQEKVSTPVVSLNTIDEETVMPANQFHQTVNEDVAYTKAPVIEDIEKGQSTYPAGIFTINHAKVIYLHAGQSLFAFSAQQQIDYKKLLSFNELSNEDILRKSQLIYLQKKPKKSDKPYCVNEKKQTLLDISQQEGVQLQALLTYNNLSADQPLQTGARILLQPPVGFRKTGK